MTTLDDIINAIRGVEEMLNDFHSEDKMKFNKVFEKQKQLYQFLGVPVEEHNALNQPVNYIFKKYYECHPINFLRMRKMLDQRFVCQIRFAYEWFALWNACYEMKILEDSTLTSFSRQMFIWYPDAPKLCKPDNIGDYSSSYLGKTPSAYWDERTYIHQMKGNQSRKAFRCISHWNEELREVLKTSLQ